MVYMEKELNLKSDEALDYIKNNVDNYDTLEISFNRIFVPGEVLDIDADDEDSLKLLIQMNGELVNDTVEIDLVRIKEDILEIRHIKDDKSILIVVDA